MKDITKEELFALFGDGLHAPIKKQLERSDVWGVIVFENVDFSSSQFGSRAAVIWGPGCTYTPEIEREIRKSPERYWLNDLPSQRQYPQAIYTNEQRLEDAADEAHLAKISD